MVQCFLFMEGLSVYLLYVKQCFLLVNHNVFLMQILKNHNHKNFINLVEIIILKRFMKPGKHWAKTKLPCLAKTTSMALKEDGLQLWQRSTLSGGFVKRTKTVSFALKPVSLAVKCKTENCAFHNKAWIWHISFFTCLTNFTRCYVVYGGWMHLLTLVQIFDAKCQ